jgi:hypothetical protein
MSKLGKAYTFLFVLAVLVIPVMFAVQILVGEPEAPKLAGSRTSVERLFTDFLDALEKGDEEAIRQLALTKEQFSQFIWPELPASAPHTNLNVDFVWNQMHMHSLADLSGTLFRNKGKKYDLVGYRFVDEMEDYRQYKVHRDARLKVVDEDGEELELNLFGSVLEMDDEFKIFSFVR